MDMINDEKDKDHKKVFKMIKELEILVGTDINLLPSFEDFNERFNEIIRELDKLIKS